MLAEEGAALGGPLWRRLGVERVAAASASWSGVASWSGSAPWVAACCAALPTLACADRHTMGQVSEAGS